MQVNELAEFTAECERFVHIARRKWRNNNHVEVPWDWHCLGSGYYSEVWAHSKYPNYVFKIAGVAGWGYERQEYWNGKDNRPMAGTPDPWYIFAEEVVKSSAWMRRKLPPIHSVHKVSEGIQWAVLGKLHPLKGDWDAMDAARTNLLRSRFAKRMFERACNELGGGVDWDLHSNNFMQDSAGRVYCTDPLSNIC